MVPKFRAWHKANKKMYKVNGISYPLRMLHLFRQDLYVEDFKVSFDDVIVMQSTGLFDKNGVEIFEGDVVRLTSVFLGKDEIRQVTLVNGGFGVTSEGTYVDSITIKLLSQVGYSLEIIGNIYENPELVQE